MQRLLIVVLGSSMVIRACPSVLLCSVSVWCCTVHGSVLRVSATWANMALTRVCSVFKALFNTCHRNDPSHVLHRRWVCFSNSSRPGCMWYAAHQMTVFTMQDTASRTCSQPSWLIFTPHSVGDCTLCVRPGSHCFAQHTVVPSWKLLLLNEQRLALLLHATARLLVLNFDTLGGEFSKQPRVN